MQLSGSEKDITKVISYRLWFWGWVVPVGELGVEERFTQIPLLDVLIKRLFGMIGRQSLPKSFVSGTLHFSD